MNEPTDVRLTGGDIAICEGGTPYVFSQGFRALVVNEMSPIVKAVAVTRLRTLADLLEASE